MSCVAIEMNSTYIMTKTKVSYCDIVDYEAIRKCWVKETFFVTICKSANKGILG